MTSKKRKIGRNSWPEVNFEKRKKTDLVHFMTHLSRKFHENPSSSFREIACTKSVRKRIIIITRFDLVASNEKVFRSIMMRRDLWWDYSIGEHFLWMNRIKELHFFEIEQKLMREEIKYISVHKTGSILSNNHYSKF